MNLNATLINLGSRFNAMSLRERAMISVALLALLVLVWDQFLMNPLRVRIWVTPPVDESKKAAGKDEPPPIAKSGPYVHSLELIVEGNYLDVLRYLQTVEGLPWRFYWQVLELKTTEYPTNRVRIRLN